MNAAYGHRYGKAVLRLTDPSGAPLKNREITVRQTKHEFLFGCAEFSAVPYACGELEGAQREYAEMRMRRMLDLCNFVTLPFYWGRFEPERGRPDTERLRRGARWLKDNGCAVKGHPLCWHTVTAPWLLDMSDEDILSAQLNRIDRDVSAFAGLIDMWDVINEVVIMPVFDKYDNGITRICKALGRVGLVGRVFGRARAANPNAVLLLNDFNMSAAYERLIGELLDAGVALSAIGLQSHMHQGFWGEEKTAEVLERFSRFGLPLHFTEVNLVSGRLMPRSIEDLNDYQVEEWPTTPEGEERQAGEAVSFYRALFACPSVRAVTWWNFTDGGWLKAPAGLLTADSRVKPSYEELRKLIKGEWWSPERRVVTDGDGAAEVTGVKGEYLAAYDGRSVSFTVS